MSLSKLALSCSLALAAMALCLAPAAHADDSTTTPVKKTAKAKAKKPAKPPVEAEPQEDEPDITGSVITDFDCELGNKITIYTNADDKEHIALRWKKRLHRLTQVGTSTGAQRFENKLFGLIWIGIPAKGMLLDSKLNRQLANECKDAEQRKPATAAQTAPAAVPAAAVNVAPNKS
ncbi:MAG TPA: hypothetical protein VGP06_17045 [Janthinobacterium sp.]|jgi:hypothetical protein|nr:hypothetical protein [Janthinobacterium sp.]